MGMVQNFWAIFAALQFAIVKALFEKFLVWLSTGNGCRHSGHSGSTASVLSASMHVTCLSLKLHVFLYLTFPYLQHAAYVLRLRESHALLRDREIRSPIQLKGAHANAASFSIHAHVHRIAVRSCDIARLRRISFANFCHERYIFLLRITLKVLLELLALSSATTGWVFLF